MSGTQSGCGNGSSPRFSLQRDGQGILSGRVTSGCETLLEQLGLLILFISLRTGE